MADSASYKAGAYFATVIHNNQTVVTPFSIYRTHLPDPPVEECIGCEINFQFDKSRYHAGDSIIITGEVNEAFRDFHRDPDKLFDYKVLFNIHSPHKSLTSSHSTTIDGHDVFFFQTKYTG